MHEYNDLKLSRFARFHDFVALWRVSQQQQQSKWENLAQEKSSFDTEISTVKAKKWLGKMKQNVKTENLHLNFIFNVYAKVSRIFHKISMKIYNIDSDQKWGLSMGWHFKSFENRKYVVASESEVNVVCYFLFMLRCSLNLGLR